MPVGLDRGGGPPPREATACDPAARHAVSAAGLPVNRDSAPDLQHRGKMQRMRTASAESSVLRIRAKLQCARLANHALGYDNVARDRRLTEPSPSHHLFPSFDSTELRVGVAAPAGTAWCATGEKQGVRWWLIVFHC